LAISFTLPIFAQEKDTVDPQIVEQVRALGMKFDEAFNRHDADAVAALYTEDAVHGTLHDGTFHGRQAIEKSYANRFQRWHPNSYAGTVDRLISVGNDVRSIGRWSEVFQDADGHVIQTCGSGAARLIGERLKTVIVTRLAFGKLVGTIVILEVRAARNRPKNQSQWDSVLGAFLQFRDIATVILGQIS
jgi:uncharacterized protein (TIGR02246 family)